MVASFQEMDLDLFGRHAKFTTSIMRSALTAIADWIRSVVEPEPWKRRYLPYDWRTQDVDNAALPSYGVNSALMLPRRSLEEQKVFLSQVRDDEYVTLDDVCATFWDHKGCL